MRKERSMDVLFGLLLFTLFTVLILTVLMSGVGAYRGIERNMQSNYDQRTAVSYLATKIRHYDTAGGVSVESFGDLNALRLRQAVDGVTYSTWVYALDGQLMELFVEDGVELPPQSGTPVLEIESLELSQDGNALQIACVGADGKHSSLRLSLRAEQEGF